ncbi:MAG: porin family protein [Chitinophagaceae bacterium]
MKKLILAVLLLVVGQATFAQSLLSRLHFGLKGGVNSSNFTDASFDTEMLTGFHAGAIVNFSITDKWSVQQEFLYSEQGAKIKDVFNTSEGDLKLSYFSVPILIKYHSNIGVYGEIGAQANMLIKDAKNTGFDKFADKVDAGGVAGIGYQFKYGPVKGLGIGARYYHGFTDVGKFTSTSVRPDFKNSVIQASVFYIF